MHGDLPDGARLPLHATAAGKALIAHLPLQRVQALQRQALAEYEATLQVAFR